VNRRRFGLKRVVLNSFQSEAPLMIHHRGTEITEDTDENGSRLTRAVIGAAIEVHRHLGPGLLESIYEQALFRELGLRGLQARRQVRVPIEYKGMTLGTGLRVDLLVSDRLIVEVKAVDGLVGLHRAQLLTYLKLTGFHIGLIINFNVELLQSGIRRIIYG
jgi:GxxExxY protein